MTQPATKKNVRPTDPMLRLTAKLDRLLAEMPEGYRKWAIAWINEKYGGQTCQEKQ